MPGNTEAIWSKVGSLSRANSTTFGLVMTTATGDYTGASANHVLIWTADPTNGGWLEAVLLKAIGTNVASVCRFYLNNGSANTTAANNQFIGELALPAVTAINTSGTVEMAYSFRRAFDPGFCLYGGLATTVASGWIPSVVSAGKY